jgi:hypothetical protein
MWEHRLCARCGSWGVHTWVHTCVHVGACVGYAGTSAVPQTRPVGAHMGAYMGGHGCVWVLWVLQLGSWVPMWVRKSGSCRCVGWARCGLWAHAAQQAAPPPQLLGLLGGLHVLAELDAPLRVQHTWRRLQAAPMPGHRHARRDQRLHHAAVLILDGQLQALGLPAAMVSGLGARPVSSHGLRLRSLACSQAMVQGLGAWPVSSHGLG